MSRRRNVVAGNAPSDTIVVMVRSGVCRASAILVLVMALLVAGRLLLGATAALADGDPASDYLITNQVFLSSQAASLSPAQRALLRTVRIANRDGVQLRVAVISSEYDLGSITALWRRPSIYARFLGIELQSAYRGRLLVAMPDGFGFNWPGHPTAAVYRLLAQVPLHSGGDALAGVAQTAVRRLAAAAGVSLEAIPRAKPAGAARAGADVPAIVGVVLGGAAALGLLGLAVIRMRRRLRRPAAQRPPRTVGRMRAPLTHLPSGLRWTLPPAALLLTALVAVTVVAVRSGARQVSITSVVTPPPFSWPAGGRPAPNFVLHDQAGRPVSPAAFRGRPVIVTFIDPLCRNLCPLEAQVLNQLERELPASQRPLILAVSVDVYSDADSRANLLETFRKWRLVAQWRWAIGAPAQLAEVWKRYNVGVSVVTKRIAGMTIHYITHTEGAYIIDRRGYERALFLWPFFPQDVRRVLGRLA